MDPKKVHDWEQGATFLAESLPPWCGRMYKNLTDQGFNHHSAMRIILTTIKCLFAPKPGDK